MTMNRIDRLLTNNPRTLLVQPRMGFSDHDTMREGLAAINSLGSSAVGTITVDSLTRQGLVDEASFALHCGDILNGYPISSYSAEKTRELTEHSVTDDFPIQVRHGSPLPQHIFHASANAGIDSIEGGPISYCLPYSRVPLAYAVGAWQEATLFWAYEARETIGRTTHIESFGGCMMGQLCPPSVLIAISIIEGIFFAEHGIDSASLSYAQGTNSAQDIGTLLALRQLTHRFLPHVNTHIVFYTWMGLFPKTNGGAKSLIKESAKVAAIGRADRLIVKTVEEAHGIPTIGDNLNALRLCQNIASKHREDRPDSQAQAWHDEIADEATELVEAVLSLGKNTGHSLQQAFKRGWLDVPYCLHDNNLNKARAYHVPDTGEIRWRNSAQLAFRKPIVGSNSALITSSSLLSGLSLHQRRHDSQLTNPSS